MYFILYSARSRFTVFLLNFLKLYEQFVCEYCINVIRSVGVSQAAVCYANTNNTSNKTFNNQRFQFDKIECMLIHRRGECRRSRDIDKYQQNSHTIGHMLPY